jgi:hypothetical protein
MKKFNLDYVVRIIATALSFVSVGIGLVAGIEFGYWPAWVLVGLGLFTGIGALWSVAEEREVEANV